MFFLVRTYLPKAKESILLGKQAGKINIAEHRVRVNDRFRNHCWQNVTPNTTDIAEIEGHEFGHLFA